MKQLVMLHSSFTGAVLYELIEIAFILLNITIAFLRCEVQSDGRY